MKEIRSELRKHGFLYLLILLHLLGGVVANIAIIASSAYAFYYFCFKKDVDLYVVFLLLYTNICMGQNTEAENVTNINVGLYSLFKNVLIIGPIALSTKFAFALAVPIRAILNIKKSSSHALLLLWYIVVLLALLGLFISFGSGQENKAGLTIGFRISLVLGVILLPQMVKTKELFFSQFNKIFIVSAISLALGLMNAHWLFITFGFLPYLWVRFKSIFLRIFVFLCLGRAVVGLETTITVIGTILISLIFTILASFSIFNDKSLKIFRILFIFLPILITIYVVLMPTDKIGYDFNSISGYIKFKLVGDRKPIWDASLLQITTQNFFIAPSGSSLEVYFDYIQQWREWPEGSHNIFLEIGRQISGFSMFFFTYLIYKSLNSAYKFASNKYEIIIILSFTSIYLAFGLSGQHIVYDGVGFMFWLLISQFALVNRNNESTTHIGS